MQKLIVLLCLLIPTAALADAAPGMPPNAEEARKQCAAAIKAYPDFADNVVQFVNAETRQEHIDAADAIAKNEQHVILAYSAIWLVAAGFVLFLWLRQRALKEELTRLRADLAAAIKEGR